MKALVLGASGATGRLAVKQLLNRKTETRILVRNGAAIPEEIIGNPLLETVRGNINELSAAEMMKLFEDCRIIVSCLGHNISFKGIFGKPRYLVRDAVRSACEALKTTTAGKTKFILMSTTGFTNSLIGEKNSFGEKIIQSLLMILLPPHRDNVQAARYLINEVGTGDERLEWAAVRPDTLVDREEVSPYKICESPERSPLFNAGQTSRINVGHFMAELAADEDLWKRWMFKTPVIYNEE